MTAYFLVMDSKRCKSPEEYSTIDIVESEKPFE